MEAVDFRNLCATLEMSRVVPDPNPHPVVRTARDTSWRTGRGRGSWRTNPVAYAELHGGMPGHAKTTALAKQLGLDRAQAVGHLACLWAYCIDRHPGGVIRSDAVEAAAEWRGEEGKLLQALLDRRWLERDGPETVALHDWAEYTKSYRKAEADRERMRRKRSEPVARQSATVARPSPSVAVTGTDQTRPELTGTDKSIRPKQPGRVKVTVNYPEEFERRWKVWPHGGKHEALKAWQKIPEELYGAIDAALAAQKTWPRFDGQVWKHLSGWLNDRHWEDEKPPDAKPPPREMTEQDRMREVLWGSADA